jgi:hypothetical protein
VPLLPLVIEIQLLVSVAAQLHPVPAVMVTLMLAAPPLAGLEALVGETVNVHGAVPLCVTVTVCPATVKVALRGLVEALADTV